MNSKQIFMMVAIIAALSAVIPTLVTAQMADNASMGNLTGGNMTGGNMTGGISSLPPS